MSRMSENVGVSASRNPKGLQGLYRENYTLPFEKTNVQVWLIGMLSVYYTTRVLILTNVTKKWKKIRVQDKERPH
jgi:hypothetical protein